jgi:CDP-paratose 2-epimerase
MLTVLVTGSGGLIGSEAVRFYCEKGYRVVGIDNDMRRYFFGDSASTASQYHQLKNAYPEQYVHETVDIRDAESLKRIFEQYQESLQLIIHTAAQPSHDWAAREPLTDFAVNATGTLHLLEHTRIFAPRAVFIFCSTNKVYGDRPNSLPLQEQETRWDLSSNHPAYTGINELMSIDTCKHSLFGASKVAADILVQEYGRYFGMKTVCFRGGCLTGAGHAGAQLHGFLSYLMRCTLAEEPYTVFGYQGKQVRDNIHSRDLLRAFDCFFQNPRIGEVYNIGGGRPNSCSMLEAIALCEQVTGKKLSWRYQPQAREGDHQWWISDLSKFKSHYPGWNITLSLEEILSEMLSQNCPKASGSNAAL